MMVYRYLNLDCGLDALQSGEWKVGRLDELNDIFDCRPRIILPRCAAPPRTADDYLKPLSALNGLICYSGTVVDPVIWSHYADKHRGMALGFNFPEGDPLAPQEVTYSKMRPVLDLNKIGTMPEDRNAGVARQKLIEAGFTKKHPSWRYEKEFRHFVPLDKCRMRGRHYFNRLLWERLDEVVLGAKCTTTMRDIDRIITNPTMDQRAQRGCDRRVKVRQCRINEASYDLDFDAFPRSS